MNASRCAQPCSSPVVVCAGMSLSHPPLAQATWALTPLFLGSYTTIPGLLHHYSRAQDPFKIFPQMLNEAHIERWCEVYWGIDDATVEAPFVCRHAVVNAPWAPAAVSMSKQVLFFAFKTCRKLSQNASKCPNINHLWQRLEGQGFSLENDTKSGLRGMPGGSYKLIKYTFSRCWMCLQHSHCKELWLREGSLDDQTRPQTCG